MIQQLFFELIRISIGTQVTLSRQPSADEWKELYAMAKKQSLVGICFAGVQRLYVSDNPESTFDSPEATKNPESITKNLDEVQYLKWMGMAAKIQQRNEVMNGCTRKALAYFREKGFPCQVLKGQGVAKLYGPLQDLRQSGDVDVWMSGGKEKAFALSIEEFGKVEGLTNYHIHFPLFEKTEIELHFKPSFLSSPLRNKRFLDFCMIYDPQDGCGDEPSLAFNRIYILLHCYRHLCGHGVGLRQLLDYYFVLVASQDTNYHELPTNLSINSSCAEYKAESMKWIITLGMERFAKATMWMMKEAFGLDGRYLLCEPDECAGRFLLNEVMHSGNMGHGEDRFDGKISERAVSRYWYNLKRDIRLIQICPHEAMWDPVFNAYQFFWCKMQKTK